MLARLEKFLIVISALASLIILFILIPIIALFIRVDPIVFRKALFEDPMYYREAWSAFLITLKAAFLSTSILLLLGVPLAYLLARYSFPLKAFIESLIDVPLMIPHAVAGIMVLIAYGRRGLLAPIVNNLGVAVDDSFWGIVAAMAFVSAPIMIDAVKAGIRGVNVSLEYVARSLGASRWRVFYTITLPLAMPSILAGCILSFARALSEVGAILIVAYYPKSINVLVIEWFLTFGLEYAIALSVIMVIVSLAIFTAMRVVIKG